MRRGLAYLLVIIMILGVVLIPLEAQASVFLGTRRLDSFGGGGYMLWIWNQHTSVNADYRTILNNANRYWNHNTSNVRTVQATQYNANYRDFLEIGSYLHEGVYGKIFPMDDVGYIVGENSYWNQVCIKL